MVKKIKYLSVVILLSLFFSSYSIAEENPDLNPSSSGGAVLVQSPMNDAEKFLSQKKWKKGRNIKPDGTEFYIVVGIGEVSVARDNKMIHDARNNAFIQAFTNAKTEFVKSKSLQVSRDIELKTYENNLPDKMAEDVVKAAVGTESGQFAKLKKLISAKLDNALKEEGYNPDLADAEKEAIKKKILRSAETTELITASTQSSISGFQSYKIFGSGNKGERQTIAVIALWSQKLNLLAKAIKDGSTNVPNLGFANKPIEEQLKLNDLDNLLASFGANMYVNENGNLVLVAYGHASPSIENDPGALNSACNIATTRAYANIVSYADEQIIYDEMQKNVSKVETFVQAGMQATEEMAGREYSEFIKSKSTMKLVGQSVIGTYRIKHPLYKSTDCVAVVKWSAENVNAINTMENNMNSDGSTTTNSSSQGATTTTESQTPSDDF
tara:strand:- start:33 stop:1352 length:1320 start_codon:yes stop_codon:yes gene_type:complete